MKAATIAGIRKLLSLLLLAGYCLAPIGASPAPTPDAAPSSGATSLYLPFIAFPAYLSTPVMHAPLIPVADITRQAFEQMAIAWFGRVSPTTNYVDVRYAYNNAELTIYLAIFDRHLFTPQPPDPANVMLGDSATSTSTRLAAAPRRHRPAPTGWQPASI